MIAVLLKSHSMYQRAIQPIVLVLSFLALDRPASAQGASGLPFGLENIEFMLEN